MSPGAALVVCAFAASGFSAVVLEYARAPEGFAKLRREAIGAEPWQLLAAVAFFTAIVVFAGPLVLGRELRIRFLLRGLPKCARCGLLHTGDCPR